MTTPAQIQPNLFEQRQNLLVTQDRHTDHLQACFNATLFPQFQCPRLSANFMAHADSANFRGNFNKEMHGDKKCPFNGVISYSWVWRKNAQKQGLEYEKHLCFLNCVKLSGSSKAQWKKMPQKTLPTRLLGRARGWWANGGAEGGGWGGCAGRTLADAAFLTQAVRPCIQLLQFSLQKTVLPLQRFLLTQTFPVLVLKVLSQQSQIVQSMPTYITLTQQFCKSINTLTQQQSNVVCVLVHTTKFPLLTSKVPISYIR